MSEQRANRERTKENRTGEELANNHRKWGVLDPIDWDPLPMENWPESNLQLEVFSMVDWEPFQGKEWPPIEDLWEDISFPDW